MVTLILEKTYRCRQQPTCEHSHLEVHTQGRWVLRCIWQMWELQWWWCMVLQSGILPTIWQNQWKDPMSPKCRCSHLQARNTNVILILCGLFGLYFSNKKAKFSIAIGSNHGVESWQNPDCQWHVDTSCLFQHSSWSNEDSRTNDGSHCDCASLYQPKRGFQTNCLFLHFLNLYTNSLVKVNLIHYLLPFSSLLLYPQVHIHIYQSCWEIFYVCVSIMLL